MKKQSTKNITNWEILPGTNKRLSQKILKHSAIYKRSDGKHE